MPNLTATAAFDVDMNRIHGYSDTFGRICYNAPEWPWEAILEHKTILVEVAGPINTAGSSAEVMNRTKWMISNSFTVGRLWYFANLVNMLDRILVSPSTSWTLKHGEKMRETVAGCSGEDNHDIRACRCMLFYHNTNPEKWVPLRSYYQNLSTKRTK